MREYIQPTTEIIATDTEKFLAGSVTTPPITDGPGGGEGFTNSTTFEQDIISSKSALWDESE